MALEDEFEQACRAAIEECRHIGYLPTAWMAMIEGPDGAVGAAKRLLANGDIQTGLQRLKRMGREDLTVERAVLDPKWAPLFDDAHRAAARWRLEQVNAS